MRVLILGGAGMVGQKLVGRLVADGLVAGTISELILHDVVAAAKPEASFPVTALVGNLADPDEARKLAGLKPDIIFHLAAIVSGEAEQNFVKGWDINARGTWWLLEALREETEASEQAYCPKLVFTSSIAVFGAPFPDKITDEFLTAPQTSYGAQKAMTELLINDYSRKGLIDGISIRLPTICVRPGKPNLAASSFFSGIIREPLNGQEAILPVPDTVRHWHASPRSAVGFLVHAVNMDTTSLGARRALNMPGVSCTVAEQIDALRVIAGSDATKLIRREPNDTIMNIVKTWAQDFAPERALALGFTAETSFDEIIKIYISEEQPGT
ncbi:D-erythronate dehydrogenase [Pararhizobium sp. IMCC21322]|uniref:D-erythronate dehydrogenase n=1 Tax=Pararhizobium sp. IMCC21322 TaxID=3067903 RepID=UPI0027423D10|nr:D-erythronate dehydrogenase [Pararhizobium sp. IMCC21322]